MSELHRLTDALIDGRLDEAGVKRLEALVLASPEALREYAERMHDNAALAWGGHAESRASGPREGAE